jgi:hypothetical protein
MFVCELECADIAAFVAHPLHQTDWVGAEFRQMSVLVRAT